MVAAWLLVAALVAGCGASPGGNDDTAQEGDAGGDG